MKTKIKIDHHIPIPPSCRRQGIAEALRACAPGDSFLLEHVRSRTGIYLLAKRIGVRVTVRKTPEGYRVWRAS